MRVRNTPTTASSAAVDDYALIDGVTNGTRKILTTNISGSGGSVSSVFARTGAVVATAGDYTATLITNTPAGNVSSATVQAAINELDTEKQAVVAALTSFAAQTIAADTLPYGSGTDTFSTTTFTAAGRALVDDASASVQRTTLGLVIGTDVEAHDTDLTAIAGVSGTGLAVRSATTPTWTLRNITGTTGVFTITNPAGVAGDINIALATKRVVARNLRAVPPQTLAATPDVRSGGSTPAENLQVWNFDAATQEYSDWYGIMDATLPTSTGLKVKFVMMGATATAGDVVWTAAFRRVGVANDIDTSKTYSFQTATVTTSGTSGIGAAVSISFSSAQIDGLLAGESFILRISRDAANGADTITGDAQLLEHSVYVEEN